jgi:hypothetical protein
MLRIRATYRFMDQEIDREIEVEDLTTLTAEERELVFNLGTGAISIGETEGAELSDFSTKDLTEELIKREAVESYRLFPGETSHRPIEGPARVIINRD